MKKLYFLLVVLCVFVSSNAQIINFSDAYFKYVLLSSDTHNGIARNISGNCIKIDANNNSEIEINEVLNVYGLSIGNWVLTNISEISYFTNLRDLDCHNNQLISLTRWV